MCVCVCVCVSVCECESVGVHRVCVCTKLQVSRDSATPTSMFNQNWLLLTLLIISHSLLGLPLFLLALPPSPSHSLSIPHILSSSPRPHLPLPIRDQVSYREQCGCVCLVAQVASTAAGILELINSGEWLCALKWSARGTAGI